MAMADEMVSTLNHYVQELFAGNAKIDNLYYNLKYKGYNNLADAIHEPVAHVMGELADRVTDMMDQNDARPVRYGLSDEIEQLEPQACFEKLLEYFENLTKVTKQVIEKADWTEEFEAKIFMEEFLNQYIIPYKKQAREWKRAMDSLGIENFNIHIKDYTHYINKEE